jgi:hypothetical protein
MSSAMAIQFNKSGSRESELSVNHPAPRGAPTTSAIKTL